MLENVGPVWAATMRLAMHLADRRALHRSAAAMRRGSEPMMRTVLEGLPIDRVTDNPEAFAAAVAGRA